MMRMTKIALKRMHTKKQWQALIKKCEMKPVTLDGLSDVDSDYDENQFRSTPAG